MYLVIPSLMRNASKSQKLVKQYLINKKNYNIHQQEFYFTQQCYATLLLIHDNILPLIPFEQFPSYQQRPQVFPLIQFLQFSSVETTKERSEVTVIQIQKRKKKSLVLKKKKKKQIQTNSHLKILSKIKNIHSCSPVPKLFPAKFFQASSGRKILLKISLIVQTIGAPTAWTTDGHFCMITIHKHLITL